MDLPAWFEGVEEFWVRGGGAVDADVDGGGGSLEDVNFLGVASELGEELDCCGTCANNSNGLVC
jgi:hypothetical protein